MMQYFSNGSSGVFDVLLGMMLHLAFAAVVVLSAIWLYKTMVGSKNKPIKNNSLSILKRRYARGEITNEEFQRMKKDLE